MGFDGGVDYALGFRYEGPSIRILSLSDGIEGPRLKTIAVYDGTVQGGAQQEGGIIGRRFCILRPQSNYLSSQEPRFP
ncbi:hypothetical protein PIB30_026618 [Stylosanthes scabra]|uniref:Jacalin-type lectin domain-containing protein n=1 Tax=Stylosanthes scabra TaxID=79078 RepID=A0ABU6WA01_9FABA|nr:hypothetical protein [Stylosanthes scabra]